MTNSGGRQLPVCVGEVTSGSGQLRPVTDDRCEAIQFPANNLVVRGRPRSAWFQCVSNLLPCHDVDKEGP